MSKIVKPKENYEYNPERRKLAKIYFKQRMIMGISNGFIIPLIATAFLYFSGTLERLANYAISTAGNIGGIVYFVFLLSIIFTIISFPLSFYGNYIYQHKYKLSKQNLRQWFVDYFKNLGIGYALGIPIEAITAYLIMTTPYWWLIAAGIGIVYNIFLIYIYPTIIFPLTNKVEQYKDLKEKKILMEICKKSGIANIKRILVTKESEKSEVANAWFIGLGKNTTIMLYDTLLNKFTKREVRTVIGHEAGHYVHNDVPKSLVFETIETLALFYIVNTVTRSVFSIETVGISLALVPVVSGGLTVLGFLAMPLTNWYGRKRELAADEFALNHVQDPLAQISSEKRLDDIALGNENPHPLLEFWFLTHPSGKRRIANVKRWMKQTRFKS